MRKSCWCINLFIGWFWFYIPVGAHRQTIHLQVTLLNQALEHYRQVANENTWASLPSNICLRPNYSSEHIINLRHNLFLTRDLPKPDTSTIPVYDKALTAADSRFQERHGLKADGIVGQLTLQALNVSPAQRMRQMELNLLRWQADTVALATPKVLVNIPDFTLQILDASNKNLWQTRVIVGQKDKRLHTASLASKISYLVLNPTWNVPNSIIRKEIIPILRKDRGYLARNNLILYRLQGARKYPISVNSVN